MKLLNLFEVEPEIYPQGTLLITYENLVKKLGAPTLIETGAFAAYWLVESDDEIVFSICCFEPEIPYHLFEWVVETKTPEDYDTVLTYFKKEED